MTVTMQHRPLWSGGSDRNSAPFPTAWVDACVGPLQLPKIRTLNKRGQSRQPPPRRPIARPTRAPPRTPAASPTTPARRAKCHCRPVNHPRRRLRLPGGLLDALQDRAGLFIEAAQKALTGGRDAAGGHLPGGSDFPRRRFAGDRD